MCTYVYIMTYVLHMESASIHNKQQNCISCHNLWHSNRPELSEQRQSGCDGDAFRCSYGTGGDEKAFLQPSVSRILLLLLQVQVTRSIPQHCQFAAALPRQYVAYKVVEPPLIDGQLDDDSWLEVPWTEPFTDIHDRPPPRFQTRAKIR